MENKTRVLFIGDSITDCGRNEDSESLGYGYVRMIHDYFVTSFPEKDLEVINKGIGGNRVTDLQARWDEDVLELNPDYVSISIGINDVWRQLDNPDIEQVYPDQFEEILTGLLKKTNAQLILMEPTVIEEDVESEGNKKLIPYIEIVRELAKKYNAILVPTHEDFISYVKTGNPYKLTTDGVHMNSAGNTLMAKSWLKACKKIGW
ncbi:SGNH/GDSL hydrolase family protein [Lederbergia citrea]|uniref:SGNH/GDSL hydrolase family protein n=1 Tax=Lederbergia citrea TaxID=2833581 RepID=A0A942UM60_9BACI|nr:SGNH/GDSL hydrolase family protein [Lederbergia citrea]MBS4178237.1 SGNH/GDSL hydrolase family protein [Lederbergia citrea]MBS4204914.1 SGNH/GDSL hydrolase family protein [Lederbergia citrea]MBS4223235.1 SGNH/GDSL hydrolase family protein [Lederbergia citrea]